METSFAFCSCQSRQVPPSISMAFLSFPAIGAPCTQWTAERYSGVDKWVFLHQLICRIAVQYVICSIDLIMWDISGNMENQTKAFRRPFSHFIIFCNSVDTKKHCRKTLLCSHHCWLKLPTSSQDQTSSNRCRLEWILELPLMVECLGW